MAIEAKVFDKLVSLDGSRVMRHTCKAGMRHMGPSSGGSLLGHTGATFGALVQLCRRRLGLIGLILVTGPCLGPVHTGPTGVIALVARKDCPV